MQNYICSSCGHSFEADPDSKGMIVCSSCGAELIEKETEHPLAAGTRVKGFEIIRHIASGGSGDVYLAEQIAMERKVALKILNSKHLSKEDIEQFFNEARNTAKFENPHVISVLEFGTSDEGLYYLATRYVEGDTIEELLSRKHYFSEIETLSTIIAVAESLSSIWDKNKMFHKDIKPANIILAKDGEVVILDMGLAQEYGTSALINGEVEGSPYYMSPEQAHGEQLSWSTDLYSLGSTMYQMLTGVYPYDAPTVQEILEMHDTAPFPEPETRAPKVKISEKTTAILRRMLGKHPEDRFTSWKEFIQVASENLLKLQNEIQQKNIAKQNADHQLTVRKSYGSQRLILFGVLLLFLAAAAAAGTSLYLASYKNSRYAEKMLRPVRNIMKEKVWNVNTLEITLDKLEKHQTHFGVKPSIKHEIKRCRARLEQYKKDIKAENAAITRFELETAEALQKVDQLQDSLNHQTPDRKISADYQKIQRILKILQNKISKYKFILPENKKRTAELKKRIGLANSASSKKIKDLLKTHKLEKMKKAELQKKKNVKNPVRPVSKTKTSQKKATPLVKAPVKSVPQKRPVPRPAVKQKTAQKIPSPAEKELQLRRETLLLKIMILSDAQKFGEVSEAERLLANEKQILWFAALKQMLDDGHKIWNAVYDSRSRFTRYTFIAEATGQQMMIGTVIKDNVYLYRPNMPNIIKKFSKFTHSEWNQFLSFAAQKTSLQKEYISYNILNGDFPETDKNLNTQIRTILPEIKRIWYGYLTGNKYAGVPASKMSRREIARRYAEDPDFRPFAHKIKIRYFNDTTKKKGRYK